METILVVDDESDVRELARNVLVAEGREVLEARDGEEALRVADAHAAPIHLLLTAVVMPRVNASPSRSAFTMNRRWGTIYRQSLQLHRRIR